MDPEWKLDETRTVMALLEMYYCTLRHGQERRLYVTREEFSRVVSRMLDMMERSTVSSEQMMLCVEELNRSVARLMGEVNRLRSLLDEDGPD